MRLIKELTLTGAPVLAKAKTAPTRITVRKYISKKE